jgi:hypothetical protein
VFKGIYKRLKLFVTHSNALSIRTPTLHGIRNFAQYLLGPRIRDAKISNHRHEGVDGHVGTRILGYPRLQFAHALRRRVDVEGRRKPPEFPIFMYEAGPSFSMSAILTEILSRVPCFYLFGAIGDSAGIGGRGSFNSIDPIRPVRSSCTAIRSHDALTGTSAMSSMR